MCDIARGKHYVPILPGSTVVTVTVDPIAAKATFEKFGRYEIRCGCGAVCLGTYNPDTAARMLRESVALDQRSDGRPRPAAEEEL